SKEARSCRGRQVKRRSSSNSGARWRRCRKTAVGSSWFPSRPQVRRSATARRGYGGRARAARVVVGGRRPPGRRRRLRSGSARAQGGEGRMEGTSGTAPTRREGGAGAGGVRFRPGRSRAQTFLQRTSGRDETRPP